MRITFDNLSQVNTESVKPEKMVKVSHFSKASASYQVAFDGKDRVGFGTEMLPKTKATEVLPANNIESSVQNYRNQMTVMSHTMSDEDFARMQEEGYDPSEMDPQDAVTILDKIKSELVKAGVHIEGYTDRMSSQTLAAAVGSEVLANSIMSHFANRDIPVQEQNVEKVMWALEIAERLTMPTQDTYYFMAVNGMSATLRDFYMASASGSKVDMESPNVYFGEAIRGYITKNVGERTKELDLNTEVDKLLTYLEVEEHAEYKETATWLIENDVPVDKDTIYRMKDILAITFPLEKEYVVEVATTAIADGRAVEMQNLADPSTNMEKAVAIFQKYHGEQALQMVQDRLQLEEIRLHMTVETNLKLLESGFSIDTAPIEETITALKQAEQELANQYFPEDANPTGKYTMYKEARTLVGKLPHLPLVTVGDWLDRVEECTLKEFYENGKILEKAFHEAGERYETLQTSPRADMGDSIRKAFANVDDVLIQNSYEVTEDNRKALRVLSYNHMDITEENMERVKKALETVERVVHKMTPAATLKMIRDGINPLEETLPDLEKYFEQLPKEYSESGEKYSRFLYRLEHSGQLTPEEKASFIGCYRLVHQIEKTDGAAIGALINSGGEINFKNLLSAVRSGKFKGMDIKVSDAIGSLSEEAVLKYSISEQIESAYKKELAEQCREIMKEAAQSPEGAFECLERSQTETTAQNLQAAKGLELHMQEFLVLRETRLQQKEKNKDIWKSLDSKEAFLHEYRAYVTEHIECVENATIEDADSTLDVRNMQLLHKQLHLVQKLMPVQEYYLPMEIGGEMTAVRLQIAQDDEWKGLVRITINSPSLGTLSGALQAQGNRVEGYFVGNQAETVMNLRQSSDIVNKSLGEEWKFCEVEYIYSESNHIPMDWTRKSTESQVSNDSLYRLSKNFLQAIKAVGDNT